MGLIKFVSGFVMALLFVIAMLSFGMNWGIDNQTNVSLAQDSGYSSINSSLMANRNQFVLDSNASGQALIDTNLDAGDEASRTGGQFKIGPKALIDTSGNIMESAWVKVFGSDNGFGIFLTTLSGLLLYISAAYIYKAWIGRNPD